MRGWERGSTSVAGTTFTLAPESTKQWSRSRRLSLRGGCPERERLMHESGAGWRLEQCGRRCESEPRGDGELGWTLVTEHIE